MKCFVKLHFRFTFTFVETYRHFLPLVSNSTGEVNCARPREQMNYFISRARTSGIFYLEQTREQNDRGAMTMFHLMYHLRINRHALNGSIDGPPAVSDNVRTLIINNLKSIYFVYQGTNFRTMRTELSMILIRYQLSPLSKLISMT